MTKRSKEGKKEPETYLGRWKVLQSLGYASYEEYLNSSLWRRIRGRVFNLRGRVCLVCKGKATQVHHLSYRVEVLTGEGLSQLVPICNKCHESLEFQDGVKREVYQMQEACVFLNLQIKGTAQPSSASPKKIKQRPIWRKASPVNGGRCRACGSSSRRGLDICKTCLGRVSCQGCGKSPRIGYAYCYACADKLDEVPTELTYADFLSLSPKKFRKGLCQTCGKNARQGSPFCRPCRESYDLEHYPECRTPPQAIPDPLKV